MKKAFLRKKVLHSQLFQFKLYSLGDHVPARSYRRNTPPVAVKANRKDIRIRLLFQMVPGWRN